MSSSTDVLLLKGLCVENPAGERVLDGVDLTVTRGQFVLIRGATGAGKSSLLRTIGLMRAQPEGELFVFGANAGELDRAERATLRRRIGLDLEDLPWVERLSVTEHLALPLRLHGASRNQIGRFVPDLLDWLDLETCARAYPSTLSTGQRRLLRLARAVITRPDLILADDPLLGLDDEAAGRAWRLLQQLNELGCTIVVASSQSEAPSRGLTHFRLEDGSLEPAKVAA